jgi:hypothetical protein
LIGYHQDVLDDVGEIGSLGCPEHPILAAERRPLSTRKGKP